MKKIYTLILLLSIISVLQAQVTIGSGIPPTKAALLDLKTRQAESIVNNVGDDENISSETGGLLLPRVKLVSTNNLEPFISTLDDDWTDATKQKALRMSLVGLTVYNIASVGTSLYPALYTWDGFKWTTSQANPSAGLEVSRQPQAFTFYETGEETVKPLEFIISGAIGTVTYQWYQVTGNNVHIRIGTPIGSGTISGTGDKTASFTPLGVIKGTTRNAKNAGFYKFYCEALDSYGKKIQSTTAEIAVGCGAKNNSGEWITFMCFNLGAENGITIKDQINAPINSHTNSPNGDHAYIPGEERVYGSLFQWGRIADSHELRNSPVIARGSMTEAEILSGNKCSGGDTGRPFVQIKKGSNWHGKFITSSVGNNANWNPSPQYSLDRLWRIGGFDQNDPCGHYNEDGTYLEFWHEGTNETSSGVAACSAGKTGWRSPSQDEWSSIYKGGSLAGTPQSASANTWIWTGGAETQISKIRGYEIKPDGATTTLFLPASGFRHSDNGNLQLVGTFGYYWSVSILSTNVHDLYFANGMVNPGNNDVRGRGMPIRCVKGN